jgi:hypothetical protein
MNKPLQVYLEEADHERLEAFARERGWTKSQAVRAAVRALTRRASSDPVLDLSGDIDALPPGLSREFDRHLNETFIAEPTVAYRARRRSPVRR